MRGNKKNRNTAKILFQMSLENGEITAERVSAVLKGLEAHPPRQHKEVLREYLLLVRRELARSQAVVEHAGPLSSELLKSLESSLSSIHGREVTAVSKENPDLIAGFRIRIGSDVYDGSIAHQLHELARAAN